MALNQIHKQLINTTNNTPKHKNLGKVERFMIIMKWVREKMKGLKVKFLAGPADVIAGRKNNEEG